MYDPSDDYYDVLKVSFGASRDEIRRAFRKAALRWHPDHNRDSEAGSTEMMSLVNEAWRVLGNRSRREEYDRERMAWRNAQSRNATYGERFRSERQEYSQPQDSRESEASPFEEIRQTPIWVQILIWLLAIALIGGILAGVVWGVIEFVKLVVALVEFTVDLVVSIVKFIVTLVVGIALVLGLLWLGYQMSSDD